MTTLESSTFSALHPCPQGPIGLRERQRRDREQAILRAAFDLIADVGYEAMTMDALAERVGLSKPTLYNHFASKEAIAIRALVRLNEDAVDAIEAIDPSLGPLARLEAFVAWLVEVRFEAPSSAFLRARAALTPARTHPDYLRAAGARVRSVTALIENAQDAGLVDRSTSAELLTHTLFALACHSDYDDLVASGGATPAEVGSAVTHLFLKGVRP